jgi:RNA polymerase sigma-70 factor (ECF subfamily)
MPVLPNCMRGASWGAKAPIVRRMLGYIRLMVDQHSQNTNLAIRLGQGDKSAAEELTPLVYEELRTLARTYLNGQRADHTLQPTALVHEAFLRLTNADQIDCNGRSHFFCIAAKTMRAILVDHARSHNAGKRGGGWDRITLQGVLTDESSYSFELLDLHDSMARLAEVDPRQAEIVELRFFGGLTGEEVAQLLEISRATVVRELSMARAWLMRAMDEASDSNGSHGH